MIPDQTLFSKVCIEMRSSFEMSCRVESMRRKAMHSM